MWMLLMAFVVVVGHCMSHIPRYACVTCTEVRLSLNRVTDEVTQSSNSAICSRRRTAFAVWIVRHRYLLTGLYTLQTNQQMCVNFFIFFITFFLPISVSFVLPTFLGAFAKLRKAIMFCHVCPFVCLSASLLKQLDFSWREIWYSSTFRRSVERI